MWSRLNRSQENWAKISPNEGGKLRSLGQGLDDAEVPLDVREDAGAGGTWTSTFDMYIYIYRERDMYVYI